jgi:beta-mannosidase
LGTDLSHGNGKPNLGKGICGMKKIDLNGTWQLTQEGKRKDVTPATVPGDIHSALLTAGKIKDPYDGMNENEVHWVGDADWRLSRTFEVDASILKEESVFLNCDCLDTFAEVLINGKEAGRSNNYFLRQRLEVRPLLKTGTNHIEVIIRSAVKAAAEEVKKMPYPIPGINPIPGFNDHINLIRKVPCHGGWDWGIRLMVGGILQDIWLGATSLGRIEHVYTVQHHKHGACELEVTAEVNAPAGGVTTLEIVCADAEVKTPVTLIPGLNLVTGKVTIRNPKRWWPNGYGEQPLYDLTVRIAGCEVRKRLGLRTLEVVNEEDGHGGLSMYFRVNGVNVFAKGANWIPCDALPQRHTRAAYADLLTSAAAANMNIIRVWGGGQYEHEAFYDLCDELGLMIWHDFMFSCSLYPATPEFLANVKREAEYQVKRLRDHVSIALWCGNNEDVGALNWFEDSKSSRDRYLIDYDRLNEGVLGKTVDEYDPTRIFWPSSPCGGRGDYSDCWHKDNRGDMHYWSVWHEGKSFDAYLDIKPRFCSEFGYQSFPSLDTIRKYARDSELNVTSPVMEHHQRNAAGNSKIVEMFTRYFRVPEGFANFVYLSQVQQALAIKIGVEHWRHLQPVCMGTIYWQLNDNWPVCSWSSLEYAGKWKLLNYAAKRFYAPTIASVFQSRAGKLEIWVTNDHQRVKPCKVKAEVRDFTGKLLSSKNYAVKAPAGGAICVESTEVDKFVPKRDDRFLVLTLQCEGETSRNEHFFTEYKRCELPQADVKTTVAPNGAGFTVTLTSDTPAFFVAVNADGIRGEFNDNMLTLLPGEKRTLTFTPKQKVSLSEFKKSLTINHLRLTYR